MDRELPIKFGLDENNGLEIWLIESWPYNFTWIPAAVFEKPELTDKQAMDNRRRTPEPRQWLCWDSQAQLKIVRNQNF